MTEYQLQLIQDGLDYKAFHDGIHAYSNLTGMDVDTALTVLALACTPQQRESMLAKTRKIEELGKLSREQKRAALGLEPLS